MINEDLNAAIVAACWEAAKRSSMTGADQSLGVYANIISGYYGGLFQALVESPRPDPDTPGSGQEWQHRQPLLQAWADGLDTAVKAVRAGKAEAALQTLASSLAEIKEKLCAGCAGATSIIKFGDASLSDIERFKALQQRNFSASNQRLADEQQQADFVEGQARAKQRRCQP